jgi:hypothetical protein
MPAVTKKFVEYAIKKAASEIDKDQLTGERWISDENSPNGGYKHIDLKGLDKEIGETLSKILGMKVVVVIMDDITKLFVGNTQLEIRTWGWYDQKCKELLKNRNEE